MNDNKSKYAKLDIFQQLADGNWAIYGKVDKRFLVIELKGEKCEIKDKGYNDCIFNYYGDSALYPGKRAYWKLTEQEQSWI